MIKETQYKTFDFTMPTLIVGMGGTGLSCAHYLEKTNTPYAFADSRNDASLPEQVKENLSPIEIMTGDSGFKHSFEDFKHYKQIIVSPGVSVRSELFTLLEEQECFILGDIELFAQLVDKPVIAITGSNGKSTVTTLVEKMAQSCGVKVIAGGNLGIPALELLETESDLYILELSSFQLETTYSLKTISATVLNISEDHMDRYDDLNDYRNVKESIYNNTENVIVNMNEPKLLDVVMKRYKKEAFNVISFSDSSINKELTSDYTLFDNKTLMEGKFKLISCDEIKLKGIFNYLNILAALALLEPLKFDQQKQLEAIKNYSGLPHRCEWIANINDVEFYNDSKGTNTGATIAAIDAFE
ncbi:MAG: UDP-N-acetylmuramoyl-L-alanine--D-glutamate ligase, partial [Gammaproteobacteria bacterium]|nr:UDP-N-acetylmuramoyl-L-alanine--D-glutamate ligase [Gammaproteobacteria bacterium]